MIRYAALFYLEEVYLGPVEAVGCTPRSMIPSLRDKEGTQDPRAKASIHRCRRELDGILSDLEVCHDSPEEVTAGAAATRLGDLVLGISSRFAVRN